MRTTAYVGTYEPEDWTLFYRGVLLGGDSPLQPIEVSGIADMPDVKSYDLEMVATHGLWPGTDWMRGRTIHMSFRVLAKDREQLATLMGEVNAAFTYGATEEDLEFQIPGVAQGATAKVRGRVRKRASTIDDKYATSLAPVVDVEFSCTDPWIVATSINEREMEASIFDAGGIDLLNDSVFDFTPEGLLIPNTAKMTPAKPAVITNGSMAETPIKAEIYGPLQGGVFFEARVGAAAADGQLLASERVSDGVGIDVLDGFPLNMEIGDKLELDSGTKKAFLTKRGYNGDLRTDITSKLTKKQWFSAKPGTTMQCYLSVGDTGAPVYYSAEFADIPKPHGKVFWQLSKFI
ncbi:hypothetical protein ABZV77_11595 [Streptomyces sp. NPDC004732]|uniref:hypothetical protein n=1 Tax=Streptomyces sp. NPDC004732 TaxID=3154290 RepID=UPI00339FBF26